ncbi:MAG: Orotidine 5'-phosphate decarboxylase [Thermoanaerobacterales bacterium 50_218]|nr:MAG: Orotidine 5'-phosphate decarboxylase [Thermoanaerobacterales bacterium 50_218]HAA89255.1 orotidine-5'-phosphate decarboxylase [Peptococcaceae bacterium]
MEAREKLIIALDVSDVEQALDLVEKLKNHVGFFKVGLELFCNHGPGIVTAIKEKGGRVFLDLKFLDIPRTAAQAAKAAVRVGADMFTVHLSGGNEMLRAVVDAVREEATGVPHPQVIGVTVLTSLGAEQLKNEVGVLRSPLEQVLFLAEQALRCGLNGVVASPREASAIRARYGSDLLIITPGIRPRGAGGDDQKRTGTPASALKAGADYLVVGRPVLRAPDPCQAAREIIQEIEEALK